jgi:hypothetical protein
LHALDARLDSLEARMKHNDRITERNADSIRGILERQGLPAPP